MNFYFKEQKDFMKITTMKKSYFKSNSKILTKNLYLVQFTNSLNYGNRLKGYYFFTFLFFNKNIKN